MYKVYTMLYNMNRAYTMYNVYSIYKVYAFKSGAILLVETF